MNMLSFYAQRFPASRENMCLWRFPENALDERRRCLDHMLTAVEDQQHPLVAEKTTQSWHRIHARVPAP